MRHLAIAIFLLISTTAFAQHPNAFVVHCPSKASHQEFLRLYLLGDHLFATKPKMPVTVESDQGDVVVCIPNLGWGVYSKDSILTSQVRLMRELTSLAEQTKPGTLLAFDRISDWAKQTLQDRVHDSDPTVDLPTQGCFEITRASGYRFNTSNRSFSSTSYGNPFGDDAAKEKEFNLELNRGGAVVVRTKEQAATEPSLPMEGIRYSGDRMAERLAIDRRVSEFFQIWHATQMETLEERIAKAMWTTAELDRWKTLRLIKTVDDLQRVSPNDYQVYHDQLRLYSIDSDPSASIRFTTRLVVKIGRRDGSKPFVFTLGQ